jgi:hypothetical protein
MLLAIVAVGLEHQERTAGLPLHLLCFLGEAVAAVSLASLDFSGAIDAKTLLRPGVAFHFGHFDPLSRFR